MRLTACKKTGQLSPTFTINHLSHTDQIFHPPKHVDHIHPNHLDILQQLWNLLLKAFLLAEIDGGSNLACS